MTIAYITAIVQAIILIAFFALVIYLIEKDKANKEELRRQEEEEYQRTDYYAVTHNSLSFIENDLGKWQEYCIYLRLESHKSAGARFLFNLYIPKETNGKYTEIDVLMIHPKGLFVFESKNYSGWIFGDAKRQMWTQTLPAGWNAHKEHFYNPIWQNNAHCKHLKEYIDGYAPIHSIVVFSDRCEFRELNLHDNTTPVIHRSDIRKTTASICAATRSTLGQDRIDEIYEQLYPFTQLSDSDKNKHATAIRINHR